MTPTKYVFDLGEIEVKFPPHLYEEERAALLYDMAKHIVEFHAPRRPSLVDRFLAWIGAR
jgi:hypothetical protein